MPQPKPVAFRLAKLVQAAQVKSGRWLLAYGLAMLALWPGVFDLWYLPAGLRLAALWLAPRRLWPALAVVEWAMLAAAAALHGHRLSAPGLWALILLSFPAYAAAVFFLKPGQRLVQIGAPAMMARLLGSAVLGAALSAPILALLHPGHGKPLDLLTGAYAFVRGDLLGILMLTPALVYLFSRGPHGRAQRAVLRDIGLLLLPALAAALALTRLEPGYAPIGLLFSFAPLLWIAVRHGCRGAAQSILPLGITLQFAQNLGIGYEMGWLQLTVIAISCGALMLGSAITAMHDGHELLAHRNRELEAKNDALEALTDELRTMAQRLASLQEQGQRELAAELHDELGQGVTALATRIALAQKQCSREQETSAALAGLRDQVRELHESLRRALRQLRPAVLDRYGLRRALEDGPLREMAEDGGLRYVTRLHGEIERLGDDAATAIYRICQEAITNCVRHAGAGRVVIELSVRPVAGGDWLWVDLDIADDGSGTTPSTPSGHGHGLLGIQTRALALGGDYRYRSAEDGTRHHVLIHAKAIA